MTKHQPTEDVPYEIDQFAIEDESTIAVAEEDQTAETKVIQEIRDYLKAEIYAQNSFDSVNLPANAKPEDKIAVFDEIAIHKGLAMHLRNVLEIINNKVREN